MIRNEMLQKLPHRHIILKFGLIINAGDTESPGGMITLQTNGIKFA